MERLPPSSIVLDGSQVTSRMPGRLCEADSGATWTAAWNDQAITLAMVSAVPPNGKPVTVDVKNTLKLESPDTLRVEVTTRVPGQSEPRSGATVYKRTGRPQTAAAAAAPRTQATLAQVAWIAGVWTGTRGTSTIEERWTPACGGSMLAVSRTLRDGLMSAFEFLCIVERDGGLVYTAMPNGRSPATDFTLTRIDDVSATFENPAHDYPKMIRYTKRPDGSLEAVISAEGGQKAQTYVFTSATTPVNRSARLGVGSAVKGFWTANKAAAGPGAVEERSRRTIAHDVTQSF